MKIISCILYHRMLVIFFSSRQCTYFKYFQKDTYLDTLLKGGSIHMYEAETNASPNKFSVFLFKSSTFVNHVSFSPFTSSVGRCWRKYISNTNFINITQVTKNFQKDITPISNFISSYLEASFLWQVFVYMFLCPGQVVLFLAQSFQFHLATCQAFACQHLKRFEIPVVHFL